MSSETIRMAVNLLEHSHAVERKSAGLVFVLSSVQGHHLEGRGDFYSFLLRKSYNAGVPALTQTLKAALPWLWTPLQAVEELSQEGSAS